MKWTPGLEASESLEAALGQGAVLAGHPPSGPGASGALGLGSERCQAFLPMSALKAAHRSCGDTPLKPPSS